MAAMNPCPCGYLGDSSGRCRCTAEQIARYRGRISGPLLDRIDMHVEVPRLDVSRLTGPAPVGTETTAIVRAAGAGCRAFASKTAPASRTAP